MGLHEVKNLTAKDTIIQTKWQPKELERKLTNTYDRGLTYRIYKELEKNTEHQGAKK